jgi:hypothetical protein
MKLELCWDRKEITTTKGWVKLSAEAFSRSMAAIRAVVEGHFNVVTCYRSIASLA